jgi:hypothetical protein
MILGQVKGTDSEWDGVGYDIYLGMNLMRDMLNNY